MSGGITIGGISVGQKKADISDLPKYVQGIVKMAARKAEEKAARKQHHDICYAQEKAMRRALKVTEATRRAKALGMPLPANRIYQEPDREPVNRLAASMFWGAKKAEAA